MAQPSTANVILFAALAFLCVDITLDWDGFSRCPKPIHKWLLSSYLLLALLVLMGLVAAQLSSGEDGHFLLNARPKGAVLQFMFSCTWLILVPLFVAWSVVGTMWGWEVQTTAPHCVPSSMHLFFLVVWQLVSFSWVIFYLGMGFMSCRAERRVRRAEQDLRDLEDPDLVQRWGHVGTLEGYSALPTAMASGGLTPAQIRSLPGEGIYGEGDVVCNPCEEEDCPICLTALQAGEKVRRLGACGHVFHRACIDLWMIRSTDCPLCKTSVHQ